MQGIFRAGLHDLALGTAFDTAFEAAFGAGLALRRKALGAVV